MWPSQNENLPRGACYTASHANQFLRVTVCHSPSSVSSFSSACDSDSGSTFTGSTFTGSTFTGSTFTGSTATAAMAAAAAALSAALYAASSSAMALGLAGPDLRKLRQRETLEEWVTGGDFRQLYGCDFGLGVGEGFFAAKAWVLALSAPVPVNRTTLTALVLPVVISCSIVNPTKSPVMRLLLSA